MCIYTHIYIYIYTHTYIHTYPTSAEAASGDSRLAFSGGSSPALITMNTMNTINHTMNNINNTTNNAIAMNTINTILTTIATITLMRRLLPHVPHGVRRGPAGHIYLSPAGLGSQFGGQQSHLCFLALP